MVETWVWTDTGENCKCVSERHGAALVVPTDGVKLKAK